MKLKEQSQFWNALFSINVELGTIVIRVSFLVNWIRNLLRYRCTVTKGIKISTALRANVYKRIKISEAIRAHFWLKRLKSPCSFTLFFPSFSSRLQFVFRRFEIYEIYKKFHAFLSNSKKKKKKYIIKSLWLLLVTFVERTETSCEASVTQCNLEI